jgi:hypothetical protein
MIMFEKFGQHQPLNRQAERYALEGVPTPASFFGCAFLPDNQARLMTGAHSAT